MPDNDKERSIFQTASDLFERFGIRRVTMNELSQTLAMSKKTLYKYVASKDELVAKLMEFRMSRIQSSLEKVVFNDTLSFEEKLKSVFKFFNSELSKFNVSFVHEIQTQHPAVWERMQELKAESIDRMFGTLIREGYKLGYVRQDVDPQVLIDMYTATLRQILTPSYILSTNYSNTEIYNMIVKIYFQGILTEKASKEFALFQS